MRRFEEIAGDPIKLDRLLLFLESQFKDKKNMTINDADLYFLTPTVIAVDGISFVYIFDNIKTLSINKSNKTVYRNVGRYFQGSLFNYDVFINLYEQFKMMEEI